MYKTILVPLDGSKRAEKILPYIEEMAKCLESRLILLEVVTPAYYLMDPQVAFMDINVEETKWRADQAKEYLEKHVQRLERDGLRAEARTEQGTVVETIIEVARKEDVDLIAMASHGRTGLSRVFYGSVAAGILNQVDRPLMLIRSLEAE